MAVVDGEVDGAADEPRWRAGVEAAWDWRAWAGRHRDDLIVVAIFAVARVFYMGVVGVRMDRLFLYFAPHLPDLGLLQDDLLRTVWYQHTQPPLFPLLVGLLMKVSPFGDDGTFQVAWLAMGLTLALVLRRVGRMIGMGRIATFVGIALVATNPALVSIEFSANYDEPTILLVAFIVLLCGRYIGSGTTRDFAWVCALGAVAVLTRTVFHPVWYLLLVAGLVLARRPSWADRRMALAAVIPALFIGVFVVKNVVLYDEPGLTSWNGPSLAKIAGSAVTKDEAQELIDDGTVSPLFGRQVFILPYDDYADALPPCTPRHRDIPVLADKVRPNDPAFVEGIPSPNYNYECFLEVNRQQGKDARAFIRKEPGKFFGAQFTGAQMFFEPALQIVFTPHNLRALRGPDEVWRHTLYPAVTLDPVADSDWAGRRVLAYGGIYLLPTVLILDLVAIALAVPAAWQLVRQRSRGGGSARRASYGARAAIGLTCLWVTVIGSAFEINENARYRLLIEPLLLLVLAWGGERLVVRSRELLARTRQIAPAPT